MAINVYSSAGPVHLSDSQFIAKGGEGSIYARDRVAYKIYSDPNQAEKSGQREKIELLKAIQHPSLLTPTDILVTKSGALTGYAMKYIKADPIMRLFATAWQRDNNFDAKKRNLLVSKMRDAVQAVHAHKALVVDGNEVNWLISGTTPYLVDTDSWQIGRFPATALMQSIKDWHSQKFTEGSDWFSWAVVTFQLYLGIHPYKGTHPKFSRADVPGRMQANASVFDPHVSLNAAVRDFSEIPVNLKDWYYAVLQEGQRTPPPLPGSSDAKGPQKVQVRQTSSGSLSHTLVCRLGDEIVKSYSTGFVLYRNTSGFFLYDVLNKTSTPLQKTEAPDTVYPVRHGTACIRVSLHKNKLRLIDSTVAGPGVEREVSGDALVLWQNALYLRDDQADYGLTRLDILSGKHVALGPQYPVWSPATHFLRGLAVMHRLGSSFLVWPRGDGLEIKRIVGLEDYIPLDGLASEGGWLLLASHRETGALRCFRAGTEEDYAASALTGAVLPSGMEVSIPEDGRLEVAKANKKREVRDPSATGDLPLFEAGGSLYYWQGSALYQLSLS